MKEEVTKKQYEWLYSGEASSYLGVNHETLRRWCISGKIRYRLNAMNGRRMFARKDLDAVREPPTLPEYCRIINKRVANGM